MKYAYFFIYGPLIEGGYDNISLPEGSIFVKNIILDLKMYLTPYGYPVITFEKGRSRGSLYKIPLTGVDKLDSIEGYFKDPSKNLTIRKSFKYNNDRVYTYVASKEFLEIIKNLNVEISDGNWLKFYNTHWKQFEDQDINDVSGNFNVKDIDDICGEFGVDSIDEVNSLLESSFRFNIMLEALNDKNKKINKDEDKITNLDLIDDEPSAEPSLDDLNEPEPVSEPTEVEPETPEVEPTLSDLNEPNDVKPYIEPKTAPPPQPATIPSSKKEAPVDKNAEPEVAISWKKEKHLRTLYNNFFKLFPKEKNLNVKFTAIKADALHPESKYLQANVTAICESEKQKGKYYNQWLQLRRQRTTQNWSVDLPCEVRCNCKSFIYVMAYSNMKNKSLAGAVTKSGKLDGHIINYNIPSNETNPNYIPALCKHLMALTKEIFNMNTGEVNKANVV